MQSKVTLYNNSQTWNPKRRYKINDVVTYLDINYQNKTGLNSDPSLEIDWEIIKVPSEFIEKVNNKTSAIIGYSETLYPNEKASHDALDMKLNISDLPTNLMLYPTTVASDIPGYVKMVTDIHAPDYNTVAVDVSTPAITGTGQLVSSRIADAGVLIGQPGVFNITVFGNIRRISGSGTASFYFKVYHRDSAGIETLICTSSTSAIVTSSTYAEFTASGIWDDGDFIPTDRIVIKTSANRITGGTDPVYQFQFGGDTPVRTLLPVPFSVVNSFDTKIKIVSENQIINSVYKNTLYRFNDGNSQYVMIPNTSEENIPIGSNFELKPIGLGAVKIQASNGVTLEIPANLDPEIFSKYDAVSIRHEETNKWGIYGALKGLGFSTVDNLAFAKTSTSLVSLYFPQIFKSSDYPEITTSKAYFILYSTDHDLSIGGKIAWGQFDSFSGNSLFGFVESGIIKSGFQAETPFLIRIPTSESGLATETLFLYYHTDGTDPDNATLQQTHLMTTTGGLLHTATWTDRGKVLGIVGDENHTGYLRIHKRGVNDYVAIHLSKAGDPGQAKYSTSTNGLTFTRQSIVERTLNMPSGAIFARIDIFPFMKESILHGFIIYTIASKKYLALVTLDNNYLPLVFKKILFSKTDLRSLGLHIESGIAYILYKEGINNDDNLYDYKMIKFKISEL